MGIAYTPITPPGLLGTLQELRLPLDALRWAPQWLRLQRQRTTAPRTVMLLPGFGAGERSMRVLGSYLRGCGHHVHAWGLGRNTGEVPQLLAAMDERLRLLHLQAGRRVVLVGWSLGGYLARELARNQPQAVRKVVTMGSPVIGGPRFTAVAAWYKARGYDLAGMEAEVAARFDVPLRVPVAAVYSKRDGVVAWQACMDHWSPKVRHIEVSETHLGLGFAPQVMTIVAQEVQRV
jgi:pimeloyl-ACP methyl ester carboxylesterase